MIKEVLEERGKNYGAFENQASLSQELKLILKAAPSFYHMTDSQKEAMEMICHKMARLFNGDPSHIDGWIDIAGYATLVADELKASQDE